jgi:hypothetical protein
MNSDSGALPAALGAELTQTDKAVGAATNGAHQAKGFPGTERPQG